MNDFSEASCNRLHGFIFSTIFYKFLPFITVSVAKIKTRHID